MSDKVWVKVDVVLAPNDCPTGNVDCWFCPYFGCVDPDNAGEPVVICRYREMTKKEES